MFIPRRLDKYVRDATPLTVEQVRAELSAGRVAVNGSEVRVPTQLIFKDDLVTLAREPIRPREVHCHFVLNKPLSVTSTVRDPEGRADLSPFMRRMPPGIFPIGRLDRSTSGLLLFTTDGDLAHAVLHPDHHTEKLYWLWLNEHVADDDPRLAQLTEGLLLRGRREKAKSVRVLHRTADFTELHVTLSEGKNRQIRRMMRALDFYLHALHRLQIGPVADPDLAPGEMRSLHGSEVEALWRATGGREGVNKKKIAALQRLAERHRAQAPDSRLEAWLRRALSSSRSGAG